MVVDCCCVIGLFITFTGFAFRVQCVYSFCIKVKTYLFKIGILVGRWLVVGVLGEVVLVFKIVFRS